jgi:hypothetical protein
MIVGPGLNTSTVEVGRIKVTVTDLVESETMKVWICVCVRDRVAVIVSGLVIALVTGVALPGSVALIATSVQL